MNNEEINKKLDEVLKKIEELQQKRTSQQDYIPGSVKQRHMGEANRFVRSGTAANRPTAGEASSQGIAMYYETDTNKLKVFNGTWKEVQLT